MKKQTCTVFVFLNNLQKQPVEKIKRIGEKLFRETVFAYRLILTKEKYLFDNLMFSGLVCGVDRNTTAYT